MYSPIEHFQAVSILPGITDVTITLIVILLIWFNLPLQDQLVPQFWSLSIETYHRSIYQFIKGNVIKTVHYPLLWVTFTLLFFSNLFGLFPYSVTPTTHLIVTLQLSLWLLGAAMIQAIVRYKWHFLALFLPAGTPLVLLPMIVIIEILAYATRILSLGIRISVNMVTGHTLVKVLGGFLYEAMVHGVSLIVLLFPMALLSVFLALEILIAYLQAYIYTFVACITIQDQLSCGLLLLLFLACFC